MGTKSTSLSRQASVGFRRRRNAARDRFRMAIPSKAGNLMTGKYSAGIACLDDGSDGSSHG